jgi:hypothetical protein
MQMILIIEIFPLLTVQYIALFILVDLNLRTKAYLYSFIQCSFVKIQGLIGYVSEYMQMHLNRLINNLCMQIIKCNYCLLLQIPFPGRYYIGAQKASVSLAGVNCIVNI